MLSGKRPGVTGIYDNNEPFVGGVKVEESLVMQFKNAGYETLGIGKLWHGGLGWPEQWTTIGKEKSIKGKINNRSVGGIAFGPIESDDDATVSDTSIADFGIAELGKKHDKPFFLTSGFHKPHMPWNVPRKYYDMHPLGRIELPPEKEGDLNDLPAAGVEMAGADGDAGIHFGSLDAVGVFAVDRMHVDVFFGLKTDRKGLQKTTIQPVQRNAVRPATQDICLI